MKKIKNFGEFGKLNEQKYEYGCSMIYFDFPKMGEIHSLINEDHIYTEDGDRTFGLEKEPHTTLLFGIHSNEVDDNQVLDASAGSEIPHELKLHNVSMFENPLYDVLKFDVDGGDSLHKINSKLKELPHTSDYPDYHPHTTIGYLKKGMGNKYISLLKSSEYTVNPSKIVYSKPNGEKVTKIISK